MPFPPKYTSCGLVIVGLVVVASLPGQARDGATEGSVVRAHKSTVTPIPRTHPASKSLEGVWRSRGYGWLWSVRDGNVTPYEESGDFCLKSDARSGPDPSDTRTRINVSADGQILTAFVKDDAYYYTFDRIEEIPAACERQPSSDPVWVLDAATTILTAHYVFFDARNIDWSGAIGEARQHVNPKTKDRELFKVLSRLLSYIPDAHVRLDATIEGTELSYNPTDDPSSRRRERRTGASPGFNDLGSHWNPEAARKLLKHARTRARGDVIYGWIDRDIGYLRIDAMEGYSLRTADKALTTVVSMFKEAKAVIIDVTMNDGGRDAVARRIAGFFAEDQTTGYLKAPGDTRERQPFQAIPVVPNSQARYTGPIYLLTSHDTLSAAEVFVLAMRALPETVHIGEATKGSLSDELYKTLPNGWTLSLSNEVYLDADGVCWEGVGIPPEIGVPIVLSPRVPRGDIDAVRRVVHHIRSQLK